MRLRQAEEVDQLWLTPEGASTYRLPLHRADAFRGANGARYVLAFAAFSVEEHLRFVLEAAHNMVVANLVGSDVSAGTICLRSSGE